MGRTVALLVIAGLVSVLTPYPGTFYIYGLIVIFIAIGFVRLWLDRQPWGRPWHHYTLTSFDFALLAFTLIYPNPLIPFDFPPQLTLRFDSSIYLFVMLAGLAFSFRPRLVLWGGLMGTLSWAVGVGWLVSLPDTIVRPEAEGVAAILAVLTEPTFVDLGVTLQTLVVFMIVASLLALIVMRSQRLVRRQALLERERSNLARYFPPETVDRLAAQDDPLSQTREQHVAVVFADLVGFTSWSEQHPPAEVIGLLRDVHGRLEAAVFTHGGTLDKFIGDGLMATFGTPDPGPQDASNALACVRTILDDFSAWNAQRQKAGLMPALISVGLHYGPVVVGDIGTERRMELAVVGDTVNVASRLEVLTRSLGCRAAVSDAAVQAVRRERASDHASLLDGFTERGPQGLRGRAAPVAVWASA